MQAISGGIHSKRTTGRRVALDGVWKEYDNFVAVRDVSFALEPGEFLTLLGPSGSGKTSTLMMVAGFDSPTRGSIKVDGTDVLSQSPQHRNFGVVFQGYALFPHMTAHENVEFPLRMRGIRTKERRKLALDMLDKVGLGAFIDRRPRELSGGQQQRVALARALVFEPDALLLDEPLGALDKNMRERMQLEIKDLQKKIGISILFVTHDQEEAMTMSDRIAVMNAGQIVQMGTPQEVYYRPATTFVASFFGETNLIPCSLTGRSGSQAKVHTAGGVAGPANLPPGFMELSHGDALLSVRPERVRVLKANEQADFAQLGTVTSCTFLGRHFRITARSENQLFSILTDDVEIASQATGGSVVRIGWMGKDAQIVLPESG